MCGIAGGDGAEDLLGELQHRGDTSRVDGNLGHVLHAVVNEVEQPLERDGRLVANCEIYDWEERADEHGIDARNDADLLLALLDRYGAEALDMVDGVYAFAYERDGEMVLARDPLGVKPLYYSTGPFAFASERQALEADGRDVRVLHPRHLLRVDEDGVTTEYRGWPFRVDEQEVDAETAAQGIAERLEQAIMARVPDEPVALLFSGGVDSAIIAAVLDRNDVDFTAYTAGARFGNVDAPRDVDAAERAADMMDIPHETVTLDLDDVRERVPAVVDRLRDASTVKIGVALTLDAALDVADERVAMSGLGAEQLYGGYARQIRDLNREGMWGLRGLFHRDLERDDIVAMRQGAELRLPFLDTALVDHAFTVPAGLKEVDGTRKHVLRMAAELLGVPHDVAWRGKRAAQYGSNMDKALDRLARDADTGKQAFLTRFRDRPDHTVAALFSGGKDSAAAVHRMQRRNSEVACLVNLQSRNDASYMFDAKDRDLVERQADAMALPLLVAETDGEKETELADLERALERAEQEFGVDGVVAGALESAYQRDRVERVADRVGLKCFAPLWGQDPASYMRWLVRTGFAIRISSVAARGLDETWVDRPLDGEAVEELIGLAGEYGFHPAGEGGGFETVAVDGPCFARPLQDR